ncbi:RimJ/RimL family protein N-acetyltransferase [Alpinimonas psychrophila]|uniref:RimJ/RimL family protein N-acetyltransferase n=2 Tax=Alpinimonas psychrophila TaxID=748908 RepID=A0A7W3PPH8_9MICO|nr:RimJ/RimL family protein N-acetyltransferase [Alpinimonas psychrophila]
MADGKAQLANRMTVREANWADCETLFMWRNDPSTRSASLETGEVSWESHGSWFRAALSSSTRHIFIVEATFAESISSVGMCRFDVENETAEVSINLNPSLRGKGLSLEVLSAALDYFRNGSRSETTIIARVRVDNPASLRLFERAGFERTHEDASVAMFELAKSKNPDGPS